MKKKSHVIISAALIASILLGSFSGLTFWKSRKKALADDGTNKFFVNENGLISVPAAVDGAEVGTEGHPFFVLEIVPYDARSYFGYLIGGCEPIDLAKAGLDGLNLPDEEYFLEVTKGGTLAYWAGDEALKSLGDVSSHKNKGTDKPIFAGTMTKKEGGSYTVEKEVKTYVKKYEASEDLKKNFTGKTVMKVGEDYIEVDPATEGNEIYLQIDQYKMKEVGAGKGDYEFEPLPVLDSIQLKNNYQEMQKFTYEQMAGKDSFLYNFGDKFKDYYIFENVKTYKNKDVFLRYAYGLAYDYNEKGIRYEVSKEEADKRVKNFKSVVYTVTPEDLNLNLGLIDRADMIYVSTNPKVLDDKGLEKFVPYQRPELFSHADTKLGKKDKNKTGADFNSNPLSWDAVKKIYTRVSDNQFKCPIIFDTETFSNANKEANKKTNYNAVFVDGTKKKFETSQATDNNMYKLLLLCLQMENTMFKALFADSTGKVLDGANFGVVNASSGLKDKNGNPITTGTFKLNQDTPVTLWSPEIFYPFSVFKPDDMMDGDKLSDKKIPDVCALCHIATPKGGSLNWQSGEMQNAVISNVYKNDGGTWMREGFEIADDKLNQTNSAIARKNQYGKAVYDFMDTITGKKVNGIDVADIIYYILHNIPRGAEVVEYSDDLSILELEPTAYFEDKSGLEKKIKVALAANMNYTGNVSITQMATQEFIGKRIEVTNDFDMLFLGDGKNPSFENFMLDKDYIYEHSGRKITLEPNNQNSYGLYGYVTHNFEGYNNDNNSSKNAPEKNFIYSGNDLTELAYDKLESMLVYYASGEIAPIILGENVAKSVLKGSKPYVDRNSNIYKLAKKYKKAVSMASLMKAGDGEAQTNADNLVVAVKNVFDKKVSIEMIGRPEEYSGMTKLSSTSASNYLSGNTVSFTFWIHDKNSATYSLVFYVDSNGDGAFSKEEKANITVYSTKNGVRYNEIDDNKLKGNELYIAKRTISGRVGSVNWKLDLVDKNGYVQASEQGFSVIKQNDRSKNEELKILQIVTDSNSYTGDTVILPTMDEIKRYLLNNDSSGMDKTTVDFIRGTYVKEGSTVVSKINGLDLKFTRMNQAQIVDEAAAKAKKNKKDLTKEDIMLVFDQYKMLVPGFADGYRLSNDSNINKIISEAIVDYSEYKAVLYTHDNTSYVGNSTSDPTSNWNKQMTLAVRAPFGMDRYEIMASQNKNTARKDVPYKPVATGDTDKSKIYTAEGTSYANNILGQGYSNGVLYRLGGKLPSGVYNAVSSYIDVINKGAITSYPYKIKDRIKTTETHTQYYQLDMENPLINVWYTLTGRNEDPFSKTSEQLDQYYALSNKDVRNNYYIYNIDNITYTGVGHSGNLTEDEVMLFINTFVAAYRASAAPVSIDILNDDAVEKDGNFFLAVDVDSADASQMIGNDIYQDYTLTKVVSYDESTNVAKYALDGAPVAEPAKRVYFKIKDDSLTGSSAKYRITIKVNGEEKNLAIYKKGTDKATERNSSNLILDSSSLDRTTVYFVDVPILIEKKDGKSAVGNTIVEFTTHAKYVINGKAQKTLDNPSEVTISPRGLFDLD